MVGAAWRRKYNFLGIKSEQQFVSPALKPGKHTIGMEFILVGVVKYHESLGKTRLHINLFRLDLKAKFAHAGRNDPCPCGSGKKFKRCHGG